FVPEKDEHWFWPGHGIRVKDRALLFYGQVHQTSPGMWGFDADGWGAFVVENPDQEPSEWTLTAARVPKDNTGVDLGNAVLLQDDHLLVYGNSQDVAIPKAYLARFELEAAMQGDLSHPEWWTGNAWGAQSERAAIVDYVVEYSVSFDQQRGEYLWVETAGGGATTLAVRTASEPQGPWSERRDVLRPPESYRPGAFVYAGKAHPELRGADLVLTYVPSTFDEVPDVIGDTLYYPYFARMTIR
ncbi:MAG TPA: DUF4185 domain-containing protein, partial [Polyangiaceae bacterium]|nr:DUF4185 domain-containing protein [Polyangiaceae bacterium]